MPTCARKVVELVPFIGNEPQVFSCLIVESQPVAVCSVWQDVSEAQGLVDQSLEDIVVE